MNNTARFLSIAAVAAFAVARFNALAANVQAAASRKLYLLDGRII